MKSLTVTIVIVAVLGLLVYTNPNMSMYAQFLRNTMLQQTRHEGEAATNTFAALLSGLTSGLLANATTRKDYVFCSVYVTEFGDTHIEALGAVNNFFVLKQSGFRYAHAKDTK